MNLTDLTEKLLSAEAIKSLHFENCVKHELQNLKWANIHSPYFEDPSSRKLRELDIISRMYFEKEIKKDIKIISDIVLMIEVKTNSNYHIICDGAIDKNHRPKENNHQIWFGYDSYMRNKKIIEILKKTELKDQDKRQIIKAFDKWLFPDSGSIVGDYKPESFDDIKRFSAFRETNIGTTKDLDNSVVWKAFLSLNSACEGYELFEWENMESDFLGDIDYATAFKISPLKVLKSLFYQRALRHTSLHKVLVVDSKLWEYSNKIYPLEYFRLIQRSVMGYTENWIDIVNTEYLRQYLAKLTKHYKEFFKRQQMKRFL